jgi:hypothetical protein
MQHIIVPSLDVVQLLSHLAELLHDLVQLLLDSDGRHVGDKLKFAYDGGV